MAARKDFAAMEARGPSGESAARAAMRSRIGHPSSVRLEEVQLNPLNPRYDEDDPAVRELANTLTHVGQLQPALVISREQFLRAYPDQDSVLGSQPWVVIVGNRRLVASRLAGRTALDVRVDADLESAEELEDRILIENIQRKDLPPLLEAAHLQRRLARPGQTVRSVGEAVGKSHTYVVQRLDLLKMIPEFQELFRAGTINIKTGRQLGGLPEGDQRAVLAAGPPYSPSLRQAVTPRSTTANHEASSGPAAHVPAAGGNPVSSSDQRSGQVDAAGDSGRPHNGAPDNGPATDQPTVEPGAGLDAPTDGQSTEQSVRVASQDRPSPGSVDSPDRSRSPVASTFASVGRLLDNALTDLDLIPDGVPTTGTGPATLSAVRRLIEDARAELDRVASSLNHYIAPHMNC